MKKNILPIHQIFSKFFSIILLFLMTLSLTLNPVAATIGKDGSRKLRAQPEKQAKKVAGKSDKSQPAAPLAPQVSFSNSTSISIPDNPATASPYPSNITVSGITGTVSTVTVTLNNLSIARPRDLDILLVGAGGQKFVIVSDTGGTTAASNTSGVTITLADAGATNLPTGTQVPLTSGTFKPTNDTVGDAFPAPAPPSPYNDPAPAGTATFNSVFGGASGAAVNGTWSLYVIDDAGGGTPAPGSIAGGWTLNITENASAAATTTALTSSLNPSNTNQAVTFTATVTSTSTVNAGTVTFVDTTTGTTLCSAVPVNASGVATCTAPANTLSERIHTITATYSGSASFATSNVSLNQTVNTATTQVGNTFTNPGGITIIDGSTAIPYPSNINVTGLTGSISKVVLKLNNATFPNTNEADFLLVGPSGQNFVFMSDVGGSVPSTGVNLTFDDAGATQLPSTGAIVTGTYRPTDYASDSDFFPAPAPASPYNTAAPGGSSTFASVFGGAAPNGTWKLYATDDAGGGGNSTVGSWSLTLTTSGDAATTTTLTSSPNPSLTTQAVLFTANVTSTSAVNSGTVTFRRGATVLCANVPVSASGVATCNVPAGTLPEGSFVISADYNGSPGNFNISTGTTTQQVDSPTVRTGNSFANNGIITIPNGGTATPYPSHIFVTGLGGTITKVTLTFNNLNAPTPDDLDFLLVGPGGQKFVFMSDAGGTATFNGNLTLDDTAAAQIPDAGPIAAATNYKPASYGGGDAFPTPAPAAPYSSAASDGTGTFANNFNGTTPGGTWSLYAIEDAGDIADTTISGWALNFTVAAAATTTTVSSSANPSVFGQPVTFTATVATVSAGTPTGTVTFLDGGVAIAGCSNLTLNASGQATCSPASLSVATHVITVQYSGDATNGFSSSNGTLSGGQVVNKANTTTGVTSSANPRGTNQSVTFTANVAVVAPGAGTRTGTIAFSSNGVPIAGCTSQAVNASGQATCTTTFATTGNYNITAVYSGDGNFNTSNNNGSPFVQGVFNPTSANVMVSGRVLNASGRGVSKAMISITDSNGQKHFAITNPFGYYRFAEVAAGETYVFAVSAKGYTFNQTAEVRTVTEDAADVNFVALPR